MACQPNSRENFPVVGDHTSEQKRRSALLSLWPKPRGERSASFLLLSVCGRNRGRKERSLPSPLAVKGAWTSFTSRFVAKTKAPKPRGERTAAFLHLSVCGQPLGLWRPSFTLGLWSKLRGEGTAAFLHLLVCGQNGRVKGARPSLTSQLVAKTER